MIIFSTMFYVTKELTKEKLIELAFEWVNGSPHYGFDNIKWNGKDLYEAKSEKQTFSVISSNDGSITAFRLENLDKDNIIWTNDFVFEENKEKNLLIVRLARDAADKESFVTRKYNRPRLMKEILKRGYGAEDNSLLISDRESFITEANLKLAEDIICGRTKYLLPIVYVTKRFIDNETILDTKELAKDLAGTAHVIVEENTDITTILKEKTEGKNPFNGAVHIFYTDRVGTRIIPEEFSDARAFRMRIVNSLCRRMSLVKVNDKYTWGTIRYQKLFEKNKKDQEKNIEMENCYEEILKLKEEEYKQWAEGLEEENKNLRAKVEYYEYAFRSKREKESGNIMLECSEKEFFEGEIKDMLLSILQREKMQMDSDPNQKGWRCYHILSAIVNENEIVGRGKNLATELKDILGRIDKVNAKDRKRLKELGFVSRETKHNKLYFHDDDRYMITLGKTPSDFRASSNAASTAVNTIVCDRYI